MRKDGPVDKRVKIHMEWGHKFGCITGARDGQRYYLGWRHCPEKKISQWYEEHYHKDKVYCTTYPDVGDQPERDKACLQDAGIALGDDILVTGCGGGNNLVLLKEEFGITKVTACDFSSLSVVHCQNWFSPEATVVQCSVDDLPFKNESFDVVLALDLTEHLPFDTYLFFLLEAARVLRPGGRFVVLPGMTLLLEHINLLPLAIIDGHLKKIGFETKMDKEWIIATKKEETNG